MTASLRFLVATVIVLTLTACGTGPTEVNSASPVNAESAAAPAQDKDAPTTTAAPKVKTTPLVDLATLQGSDPVLSGTVKMNGTVYDNSMYVQRCLTEAAIFYDLNRSYTKLTAVVGLDDRTMNPEEAELKAVTEVKAAVTVTVSADGVVKSTTTPRLGAPVPLEIDVTNVLRLRIDVTGGYLCWPAGGMYTIVGFGNAQLTPKA